MPATYGSLPFAEALAYLKAKLNLPTKRWDDLLGAAHDRAFVVAGALQADLLADLHAAVNKTRDQGITLAEFKKDFEKIVAERGWTGWTGEGSKVGRAWRARVIYETNLQTSYSAGRYQQMQAIAKVRPYWRYRHNDAVTHPRAEHLAWDGKALRADDPWWSTHYPPCGWGCRCFVESLAERDLKRLGIAPIQGADMPYNGTVEQVDKRTGEVLTLPEGVDRGWDYAPGANRTTPLYDLVARKLPALYPNLGAAMWEHLRDAVAMEQQLKLWDFIQATKNVQRPTGAAMIVHAVAPQTVQALANEGVALQSADVWLHDRDLAHALRDIKEGIGMAVSEAVWRNLPNHLASATAYLDTQDAALIYAFSVPEGTGKVVVRINYTDKLRDGDQRIRLTGNFIRTASVVNAIDISGHARYKELM